MEWGHLVINSVPYIAKQRYLLCKKKKKYVDTISTLSEVERSPLSKNFVFQIFCKSCN